MLKSFFGSVSSRRHRQSPMVAAQVSPLERRELLDGTTGYGSYDPYGTNSSGSGSGASSSSGYSDPYAGGSTSGSMSASSSGSMFSSGTGSANQSGSSSGSQPPQTTGWVAVQVADPNDSMNRWTLNFSGAASSDMPTGAAGPTGATGSAGTAGAAVPGSPPSSSMESLMAVSDIPFVIRGYVDCTATLHIVDGRGVERTRSVNGSFEESLTEIADGRNMTTVRTWLIDDYWGTMISQVEEATENIIEFAWDTEELLIPTRTMADPLLVFAAEQATNSLFSMIQLDQMANEEFNLNSNGPTVPQWIDILSARRDAAKDVVKNEIISLGNLAIGAADTNSVFRLRMGASSPFSDTPSGQYNDISAKIQAMSASGDPGIHWSFTPHLPNISVDTLMRDPNASWVTAVHDTTMDVGVEAIFDIPTRGIQGRVGTTVLGAGFDNPQGFSLWTQFTMDPKVVQGQNANRRFMIGVLRSDYRDISNPGQGKHKEQGLFLQGGWIR